MKKCTQCGRELPATSDYFPVSKQVKCGLRSACRRCTSVKQKAYHKQYYAKNKEKVNRKNTENYYKRNPKEILPDDMKRCSVCNEIKAISQFGKSGKNKDGLRGQCKDCRQQEYLANREKRVQQSREYYRNNKQRCLKLNKEYRKKNSEWYRDYNKQYYLENTDKIKSSAKKSLYKRMNEDEGFLILQRCRKRMYDALKGYVKSARTRQLLGCSTDTLREHIEQQFENGMTWGNYGKWHVDHIMPCALFDFTKKEDQQKCFHYTNLQPLWASENLSKSDKVDGISCRSMGVV